MTAAKVGQADWVALAALAALTDTLRDLCDAEHLDALLREQGET